MEKKQTSYQRLKQSKQHVEALKDKAILFAVTAADIAVETERKTKETLHKKDVEYNVLKEAFELLGGHEAVEKKLAEQKLASEAQRQQEAPSLTEKRYQQQQHNDELKAKAKLLKQEMKYSQNGHEFDKSLSIMERQAKINEAVDKDKTYAKLFDKAERHEKWERRIEPIKNVATATKNTAKELVSQPLNRNVLIPAAITAKAIKEDIADDLKSKANFFKKVNNLRKDVSKSLKLSVMKHTMIDKKQITPEEKWGVVASRAATNTSLKVGTKLQLKFGHLMDKVSDKVNKTLMETKATFNKHLQDAKSKSTDKTKEKSDMEL